MKGFILIGLAVLIVLLAGYGGVVSIDKAMGDSPLYTQKKSVNDQMLHSGGADDSETLECSQKDVENVDPLISKGAEKVRFGGVDFISSLESGLIEADSKSMPAFVYFHSRSCGWCKKFEEEVLTDKEVISAIKSSFIPISIDVNEQGKISRSFDVWGTPTMVFLDGDMEIRRVRGYMDAETFSATLNEIKK
jgi:thioredoxin-related protein